MSSWYKKPPNLRGLHLWDMWLGSEGSRVRNQDKTLCLFILLPHSFIRSSLPSSSKTRIGNLDSIIVFVANMSRGSRGNYVYIKVNSFKC